MFFIEEKAKPKCCPFPKFFPIRDMQPSPEEISKFMRINVDILKQEITEHIDKEFQKN